MEREKSPVFKDRVSRGMTRPQYAAFLGFENIESGVRQIHRWESAGVPKNSAQATSRLCGATGREESYFTGQRDDSSRPKSLSVEERLEAAITEATASLMAALADARRASPSYGRRATDHKEMVA